MSEKENNELGSDSISAWIEKEDFENNKTYIKIKNPTIYPIYEVIVTVVNFRDCLLKTKISHFHFSAFISIIPNGEFYATVQSDYYGMSFRPAVEIAFKDRNNRFWLCKGFGEFSEIDSPPVKYYGLVEPLPWQILQKYL